MPFFTIPYTQTASSSLLSHGPTQKPDNPSLHMDSPSLGMIESPHLFGQALHLLDLASYVLLLVSSYSMWMTCSAALTSSLLRHEPLILLNFLRL